MRLGKILLIIGAVSTSVGSINSICGIIQFCKTNKITKGNFYFLFTGTNILIFTAIILVIILILIFYDILGIFLLWCKYKIFHRQDTFIAVHKLMHETRDNLTKDNKFTEEIFLKHFLHIIYDNLLKHISKDFTISLKIEEKENKLFIIRHPESKATNERSTINYKYKNEIEDNIFINSIIESGHILMSNNINTGYLHIYECNNYKKKYLEKKKNTISHDILNKCSKYYKSVANFPIKCEFDDKFRRLLNFKEKRRVLGVLCIDHPNKEYSSFVGKKCINIFGYIADFLFMIIFVEKGMDKIYSVNSQLRKELEKNQEIQLTNEVKNEQQIQE